MRARPEPLPRAWEGLLAAQMLRHVPDEGAVRTPSALVVEYVVPGVFWATTLALVLWYNIVYLSFGSTPSNLGMLLVQVYAFTFCRRYFRGDHLARLLCDARACDDAAVEWQLRAHLVGWGVAWALVVLLFVGMSIEWLVNMYDDLSVFLSTHLIFYLINVLYWSFVVTAVVVLSLCCRLHCIQLEHWRRTFIGAAPASDGDDKTGAAPQPDEGTRLLSASATLADEMHASRSLQQNDDGPLAPAKLIAMLPRLMASHLVLQRAITRTAAVFSSFIILCSILFTALLLLYLSTYLTNRDTPNYTIVAIILSFTIAFLGMLYLPTQVTSASAVCVGRAAAWVAVECAGVPKGDADADALPGRDALRLQGLALQQRTVTLQYFSEGERGFVVLSTPLTFNFVVTMAWGLLGLVVALFGINVGT